MQLDFTRRFGAFVLGVVLMPIGIIVCFLVFMVFLLLPFVAFLNPDIYVSSKTKEPII